jgi:hypothetical protein
MITRIGRVLAIVLLAFALVPSPASAVPATARSAGAGIEADDWDGPSRVGRLTWVAGGVAVRPSETDEWARAQRNMPIFEGDEIWSDERSRAEVQFGARDFLRFADGANVTFWRVEDDFTQIGLRSGTATLSIADLGRSERLELDAPAAALLPRRAGAYRIDVANNGDTWITVTRGEAMVETTAGSFHAFERDVVSVSYDDPYDVDIHSDAADRGDEWDDWNSTREGYYDDLYRRDHPPDVSVYYGRNDMYGLADLALFGAWLVIGGQSVWRPNRTYSGWSPYRDGYWDYSPRYGWVWVSNEPWGWAPYHYGRWDYSPQYGWYWSPAMGPGGPPARYVWSPGVVHFYRPPGSSYLVWVPLAPGERYYGYTVVRTTTVSYVPRHLQAQRGMVYITEAGLQRRDAPLRTAARVPLGLDSTRTSTTVVALPKPVTVVAPVKAARIRPPEVVKTRTVVIGVDSAARTAVTTGVKKADGKPLTVERKPSVEGVQVVAARPGPGSRRTGKKSVTTATGGSAVTTAPANETVMSGRTGSAGTVETSGKNAGGTGGGKKKGKKGHGIGNTSSGNEAGETPPTGKGARRNGGAAGPVEDSAGTTDKPKKAKPPGRATELGAPGDAGSAGGKGKGKGKGVAGATAAGVSGGTGSGTGSTSGAGKSGPSGSSATVAGGSSSGVAAENTNAGRMKTGKGKNKDKNKNKQNSGGEQP